MDKICAYTVLHNASIQMVCKNAKPFFGETSAVPGALPSVIRGPKTPYFCNDVSKDPFFKSSSRIQKELMIPITRHHKAVAVIHFQRKAQRKNFTKNDVKIIHSLLSLFNKPLDNMKKYLAAKALNVSLSKKIEEQQRKASDLKKEGAILGKSKAIQKAIQLGDKVALSDTNILIEGERGTGKSLMAKRIHDHSKRAGKHYMAADCSLPDKEALCKKLFGHEIIHTGGKKEAVCGLARTGKWWNATS